MTQAQERYEFNHAKAPVLAAQLGFTHAAGQTLSIRFAYFEDESRFLVVAGAQEGTDVQRALATGVAHRGDRQLVIALPAGHTNATQQRSAWLTAGARPQLHEHNDDDVSPLQPRTTGDTVADLRHKLRPDSPSAELAKASKPLYLGAEGDSVRHLVDWAATHPDLDSAHRRGVRSWQSNGQRVLTIQRAGTGIQVTAGIHYTSDEQAPKPFTIPAGETMTDHTLTDIQDRVTTAITHRRSGESPIHKPDEHWLQAVIRRSPRLVGVEQPALREIPAWRPADSPAEWGRGFIDLLGRDGHGNIRIIETKLASNQDELLVLQGLDYYLWATVFREVLQTQLTTHDNAHLEIHYVLGVASGKTASLPPVTRALACALSRQIRWHFHTVADWYDENGKTNAAMRPKHTLL